MLFPPLVSRPHGNSSKTQRAVWKRLLLLLSLAITSGAIVMGLCRAEAQPPETLRIAAAADLEPVLPPLLEEFQKKTGRKDEAAYGSSATPATHLVNGLPFGLFLAADLSFPQKVIAAGLAHSTSPIPYARGTLVLWARNDSAMQPLRLESLRDPKLRTLAVA